MGWNTTQAVGHINDAISNNSLIIFVGAGVSMNSGFPSWKSLTDKFKNELDLDDDENDDLKIAQYYFNTVGHQKYIQKIVETFNINARPNDIHDEILRIKPCHIITTNYDSLIEDRVNDEIERYEVIKQNSDIPYSKAQSYLIKMHGDFELKNIILKEEDYLDYEENFYMISTLIQTLIMNNTVLFIGYSLNDSTFNSIFRMMQKGFGPDARMAYFYTSDEQSTARVEYYKNKGIHVITDDSQLENKDIGKKEKLINFLKKLKSENYALPTTSSELWDNIKFLDELSFVETRMVTAKANLSEKVYLHPVNTFFAEPKEIVPFCVSNNQEIVRFLNNKTWFEKFLDYENNSKFEVDANDVLIDAYDLYKDFRFESAIQKFRDIANSSFAKRDYWNYLVAEFNIKHITKFPPSDESDSKLTESVFGHDDLHKAIETLILTGDEETKRLCSYFRDEILNFKFVYKKMFKLNDLMNDIRNERYNYKNGGSSSNAHLWNVKFEYYSFLTFIEANCIAIFHYKEFQTIVNHYFECLLIAHDISKYPANKHSLFGGTASVVEELTMEDVKKIVPYIKKKNISYLMDNYGLSKIAVSDEAREFIINQIALLSKKLKSSYDYDQANTIAKYVNFLMIIEIDDINKVIPLLDDYPIYHFNSKDIRNLLSVVVNGRKSIQDHSLLRLKKIFNQHISRIVGNGDLLNAHRENFYLYAQLLDHINKRDPGYYVSIDNLEEKLILINKKLERLKNIKEYEDLLIYFYCYFSSDLKEILEEILDKYEQLPDSEISINFVLNMVKNGIHKFNSKKKLILESNVLSLSEIEDMSIGVVYPRKKDKALRDLFTLIQLEYITLDELKENINTDIMQGVFPEVDWTLFNDYSDKTIEELMKKRRYSSVIEHFGKTKKERNILNKWLLKQAMNNKVEFKYHKSD